MVLSVVRLVGLVIIIFMSPKIGLDFVPDAGSYEFKLICSHKAYIYPWRFLYIYLFDVSNAIIDLIIFILQPKTFGQKERLKEARIEVIE